MFHFIHSFIHSFLTPLLLLPETLAKVLRLSEKVKNSLFREGCYFLNPCLSTAVAAAFERKAGYQSKEEGLWDQVWAHLCKYR